MKHKRIIIIFLVVLALIMLFLFWLKTLIPQYPNLVPAVETFVQTYGLAGGFVISFVGSLWFILFPYEIILAPFIKFYNPPFLAILIFAFGATLADLINFFTGRKLGQVWIEKKVKKETLEKIKTFLDKWGIPTLFLFGFLGPVTSYDIVAFIMGGFSDMKAKLFAVITIICRIIHFSIVWILADILLKISGIPI